MQAMLEVKEGEKPYKAGISEWLKDDDGPVIFKMISKKRLDGKIEMVLYTQRSGALKRVIQHISFAEADFWPIMDAFYDTMKKFIHNFAMEVQNVDMEDTQNFRIGKNTKTTLLKFRILAWFESKCHSLKTFFKK